MKKLFILLFVLGSFSANAQFDIDPKKFIDALIGPVESDRPGQALNPTTCGTMAIQLQTGYNYSRFEDLVTTYNSSFVPVNLRVGLTKKWEINTSFWYLHQKFANSFATTTFSGFTGSELGARYAFLSGDRWVPYMALQANMRFSKRNGDFQQPKMGSSFYLATSNRFNVMSVNTNFGIVFPGDDNGQINPSYPWVLNFGWMIGDKFGVFVEGFGDFGTIVIGSPTVVNPLISWDAGGSFLVINDLQLDLFGGMYNVANQQNYWFAEFGVTYRFSFLKMFAMKKADEFMKSMGQ